MAKTKGTKPKAGGNTIDYDAAVAEGKAILAAEESGRMRLAELAAQIETEYGKNKLADFAKDIGVAFCTVERARSVWNAWAKIPAARPESYSVARELQSVARDDPERAKRIIAENPNLTSRRAHKLAKKQKPQNDTEKEIKKWFVDLVNRASKAIQDELKVETPEMRQILLNVVEPKLLDTVRAGGETWIRLANHLKEHLFDEASHDEGA